MNRRSLFGLFAGALLTPYALKRLPVPVEPPVPALEPVPNMSSRASVVTDANGYITGWHIYDGPAPEFNTVFSIRADRFQIIDPDVLPLYPFGVSLIEAL